MILLYLPFVGSLLGSALTGDFHAKCVDVIQKIDQEA